jgi:hypothetical protein
MWYSIRAWKTAQGTQASSFLVQSEPPQKDTLPRLIKAKAEELARAFREDDFAKFVALTHPALVKKLGGKETMIEDMKRDQENRKNAGMVIESNILESPKEVVAGGSDLFAIVPQTETLRMELTRKRMTLKSVWIAVSSDQGITWTFLHGSIFTYERVQDTLPTFPNTLIIPNTEKPLVEKIK